MENVSKALIIVSSFIIAMLIVSVSGIAYTSISNFAQRQVIAEDVSEIRQFNQKFEEFNSKATHDFSGKAYPIPIGATTEDVLSIVNYTNHVNKSTPYRVDFNLILNGKTIKAEDFTFKKQQEFMEQDLETKESSPEKSRVRYSSKIEYDTSSATGRVNKVTIRIYR